MNPTRPTVVSGPFGRALKCSLPALALLTVTACATAPQATPGSSPSTVSPALVDIGEGLKGPAGLSASTYARGLVNASGFALGPDGALWVATAAAQDQGTDAVYVVTRPGAKPTRVITEVRIPMGLTWIDDTLYVASLGRVDAFDSFDGSGFAHTWPVITLPDGVGLGSGLVHSADGRLHLGVSAPCDACTPNTEYAGAVISFRPDGSDLRVDARAIRAPTGLALFPGSDDLLAIMNQRDDLGPATPGDWLSLVRPGQNWRFPDCYGQGGAACVGAPRPVAELDAHAAAAGIAIVTGQLGPTVADAAIVSEWALGKVQRVTLARNAGTYTGTVAPFLTGILKPTALIVAPDGALLVGDWATGTVFRIAT